jgi:hypothetical protein
MELTKVRFPGEELTMGPTPEELRAMRRGITVNGKPLSEYETSVEIEGRA